MCKPFASASVITLKTNGCNDYQKLEGHGLLLKYS